MRQVDSAEILPPKEPIIDEGAASVESSLEVVDQVKNHRVVEPVDQIHEKITQIIPKDVSTKSENIVKEEESTPTRFDQQQKTTRKHRRRSGSIAAKLDWEAVVHQSKQSNEEKKRLVRASTMNAVTPPDPTDTVSRKKWHQVANETTENKRRQSLALSELRAKEVRSLRAAPETEKPFVQMLQDELRKSIDQARLAGRRASLSRAEQVKQELAAANVRAQIERLEALIERIGNLDERRARALWKACLRSQINPSSFFEDDGHGWGLDDDDGQSDDEDDDSIDPLSARNLDTGEFIPMSFLNARVTCRSKFEQDLERLLDLTEDDLLALCHSSTDGGSNLKQILAACFSPTQQRRLAMQQEAEQTTEGLLLTRATTS
mmetsp:Transcript_11354/g.16979  ORF Transcript_11354/g.16979 Transcript_11354/m.16979 type:complete len:377 (+) Transcript_11354:167-1297(+)